MPIYEYICMKCNERFSLLQNISCDQKETKCPTCSSGDLKKMMSSFCCASGSGKSMSSSVPSGGFSGGG